MTSQVLVYLLCSLAILALVGRSWRRRTNATLPLPPGPPPLPVFGNVHQAPKSHAWLRYYAWSQEYGPVMHLNMAGQPIVILSSVKAAQDLIARRGAKYSDRPRLVVAGELAMKGMHIMLRNNDEQLRAHQKLQAPFLTPAASASYRAVQDLESRQLLHDLLTKGNDAGVHYHDELERTVASTIYSLVYGHRLSAADAPQLVAARKVQEKLGRFLAVGAYIVDSLPFLQDLPLPRALTPWKDEAEDNFVQQRALHVGNMETGLASGARWNFSKGFKKSVEGGEKGGAGAGMTPVEVAFDLGILSDAALDTTTMTLDWFVVAWLTQTGSSEENGDGGFVGRAQRLLDEVVGHDRLPSFEDRPKLAYIDAIIEEVLRWRPIVGAGVAHATRVEDVYEGYRIPAGSIVLPNHWALMRDTSVFGDDVEDFRPERWVEEGEKGEVKIKDLNTPAFGYGRRICPGRHIARNSLWIIVARMLWAFRPEAGMLEKDGERKRFVVDPNAGTDGLLTKPLPFNVQFHPRGQWATEVLARECADAAGRDPTELLDRIGETKAWDL